MNEEYNIEIEDCTNSTEQSRRKNWHDVIISNGCYYGNSDGSGALPTKFIMKNREKKRGLFDTYIVNPNSPNFYISPKHIVDGVAIFEVFGPELQTAIKLATEYQKIWKCKVKIKHMAKYYIECKDKCLKQWGIIGTNK